MYRKHFVGQEFSDIAWAREDIGKHQELGDGVLLAVVRVDQFSVARGDLSESMTAILNR